MQQFLTVFFFFLRSIDNRKTRRNVYIKPQKYLPRYFRVNNDIYFVTKKCFRGRNLEKKNKRFSSFRQVQQKSSISQFVTFPIFNVTNCFLKIRKLNSHCYLDSLYLTIFSYHIQLSRYFIVSLILDHPLYFQTNLPVFKTKDSNVRRRYSDFEWLRNELERDSKVSFKLVET